MEALILLNHSMALTWPLSTKNEWARPSTLPEYPLRLLGLKSRHNSI